MYLQEKVNFNGVEVIVSGTYYSGSSQVFYYSDGSGHPGDPAEFEIDSVFYNGVDVTELLEPYMEEIEIVTLETIEY